MVFVFTPSGRHESERKRVRGKEKEIEVGKSVVGVRESGSKGKKTTTKKNEQAPLTYGTLSNGNQWPVLSNCEICHLPAISAS